MREITKTVLKFFAGFLLVLLVSSLLAPWLYSFLPFKFDRILRRLIMIGSILLASGFIGTRRKSLERLGLGWRKGNLELLGMGFVAGMAIVGGISLIQWALGARLWRVYPTDVWHWMGFFLKGLGAGVLIGLLEEFFFRGFLFLAFKDLWNTKASLVATNLIYAVVHLFPKGRLPMGPEPTVGDSFRLLAAFLPSGEALPGMLPGILGLFLFGLILSLLFLSTGSLFPSIGLHAGAVFSLKLNRRFLPDISETTGILSGGKNLYDGIVGLAFLALFSFFLSRRTWGRVKP